MSNLGPRQPNRPTRREGFVGQHMTVVPPPVLVRAGQKLLLKNLMVTDAGYYPRAEGHLVERPDGISTHLLIACLQGAGWAESAGKRIQVEAGDLLWLCANYVHRYGADEHKPWTIVWAHFTGAEVPSWQEELGWGTRDSIGQVRIGRPLVATLGLDKVYAQLEAGYSTQHLLAASAALRQVFCAALRLMNSPGSVRTAEERTAAVREAIVADPARELSLPEMATTAGLSASHFSALFRRQTGYAPVDFVIRERIRKACRILAGTHNTVAEVAAETGFSDAYYFSRCFSRVMGFSPREHRKRIKS